MEKDKLTKLLLFHKYENDKHKFYISVKSNLKMDDGKTIYDFVEIELRYLENYYKLVFNYEEPLSKLYEQCVIVEYIGRTCGVLAYDFDTEEYFKIVNSKKFGDVVHIELTDTIIVENNNENNLIINCVTETDKEIGLNIKELYPKIINATKSQLNLLNMYNLEYGIENQNTYYRGCSSGTLTLKDCEFIGNVSIIDTSGMFYNVRIENSSIIDINILLSVSTIYNSALKGLSYRNVTLLDRCNHMEIEYIISNSEVIIVPIREDKRHEVVNKVTIELENDVKRLEIYDNDSLELLCTMNEESEVLEVCKNIVSYGSNKSNSWIYLENDNSLGNLLQDSTFVCSIKMLSYPDGKSVKDTEVACIYTDINNYDKTWVTYLVASRGTLIPLEKAIINKKIKGVNSELIKYSNDNIRNFLRLLKNNK